MQSEVALQVYASKPRVLAYENRYGDAASVAITCFTANGDCLVTVPSPPRVKTQPSGNGCANTMRWVFGRTRWRERRDLLCSESRSSPRFD